MAQDIHYQECRDGQRLAHVKRPGTGPGVMFLGGFRSSMHGAKALAIEAHCRETGRACLRFDYSGHGHSDGQFEAGTIGHWLDDALHILDHVADGPQILVGSSLGGWIALLVALRRPERVAGLLGIATAADFTAHVHEKLFSNVQRQQLSATGRVLVPDCHGGEPFAITRRLIEEARTHLLLKRRSLPITVPVRLLHGQKDQDVPWQTSLEIAERLAGLDVEVTLVKDGEHQLARDRDIALILTQLDRLAADIG